MIILDLDRIKERRDNKVCAVHCANKRELNQLLISCIAGGIEAKRDYGPFRGSYFCIRDKTLYGCLVARDSEIVEFRDIASHLPDSGAEPIHFSVLPKICTMTLLMPLEDFYIKGALSSTLYGPFHFNADASHLLDSNDALADSRVIYVLNNLDKVCSSFYKQGSFSEKELIVLRGLYAMGIKWLSKKKDCFCGYKRDSAFFSSHEDICDADARLPLNIFSDDNIPVGLVLNVERSLGLVEGK